MSPPPRPTPKHVNVGSTKLVITPSLLPPLPPHPASNVVILDATFLFQPTPADRDPKLEFYARHLAGARFWSLKDVSEPSDRFVLVFPSPERFAAAASAAGIDEDTWVIVYDSEGSFSAPRTVFTFLVRQARQIRADVPGVRTQKGIDP